MCEERPKFSDGGLTELDKYFDVLSNTRRRYTLYYLSQNEVCKIRELARQITAWETERSPHNVSEEECKQTQLDLQHNHLPRLDDYGLIDFDLRGGDIRLAEPSQMLVALLAFCELIERPYK